jgi:hypothetical protein
MSGLPRGNRTRATSPLVPASDAFLLDSTQLSEDEVLRRVEEVVQSKLKAVRRLSAASANRLLHSAKIVIEPVERFLEPWRQRNAVA